MGRDPLFRPNFQSSTPSVAASEKADSSGRYVISRIGRRVAAIYLTSLLHGVFRDVGRQVAVAGLRELHAPSIQAFMVNSRASNRLTRRLEKHHSECRRMGCIVCIVVVLVACFAFHQLSGNIRNSYLGWWVVSMVVERLKANDDQWPTCWDGLRDDYETCIDRAGRAWSFRAAFKSTGT